MFCPNCGSENKIEQNFCRLCGLKLEMIAREIAEQKPSKEYAELKRRKEAFEKVGVLSLSVTGLIAAGFFLAKVIEVKSIIFGASFLFWAGFTALVVFGLLSVFFLNYPKLFMNLDKLNPRLDASEQEQISMPTQKLIEEREFEPAAAGSVTENSTELLVNKNQTRKFN